MDNYYEILGVSEAATTEDVKKAFRDLAKQHHPDIGGDANRFKKIVEAYRVLSDAKLRSEYDTKRKFGGRFNVGPENFGDLGAFFRGQNLEDVFGDLLGDFFGEGAPQQNLDIMLDLELELPEVLRGAEKRVAYQRKVACERCGGSRSETGKFVRCSGCNGTGRIRSRNSFLTGLLFETQQPCKQCRGHGRIPEKICGSCQGRGVVTHKETLTVTLPHGFDPRELIAIPNAGDQDAESGRSGQLLVRVYLKPHPTVKIKGTNLLTEFPISIFDAILGGKFELNFLGERVTIEIPPGVNVGDSIRIQGKGIARGDLLVQIILQHPKKKLSPKAKKLLEELRDEMS